MRPNQDVKAGSSWHVGNPCWAAAGRGGSCPTRCILKTRCFRGASAPLTRPLFRGDVFLHHLPGRNSLSPHVPVSLRARLHPPPGPPPPCAVEVCKRPWPTTPGTWPPWPLLAHRDPWPLTPTPGKTKQGLFEPPALLRTTRPRLCVLHCPAFLQNTILRSCSLPSSLPPLQVFSLLPRCLLLAPPCLFIAHPAAAAPGSPCTRRRPSRPWKRRSQ